MAVRPRSESGKEKGKQLAGTVKEVDIKRRESGKGTGRRPALGRVLRGVMFNKDVAHPRMRRKIVSPRVCCCSTVR